MADYPIYFDNTKIFKPYKWGRSNNPVRKKYTTEAGTDQIDTIRAQKWTISCEFHVSSTGAAVLEEFALKDSISLRSYEPKSEGYSIRNVIMENFTENMLENSENVTDSVGLYKITFDLVEI